MDREVKRAKRDAPRMVPFDKQTMTVVRQSWIGIDASQTEEASLIFCYIGVPNVEASGNVWLTEEHYAFVAPEPRAAGS